MTNNAPSLLVAVADHAAVVKVNGRANFTTSITFKRLVSELTERGYENLVLDLSDCVTMDSTFLGVLAGTALRFSGPRREAENGNQPESPLRLFNPNQRVADLLENLGVSELFITVYSGGPAAPEQALTPAEEVRPSREELSRTCLEAHQILMEINPANVTRFKDVTQFLAEGSRKPGQEPSKTAVP